MDAKQQAAINAHLLALNTQATLLLSSVIETNWWQGVEVAGKHLHYCKMLALYRKAIAANETEAAAMRLHWLIAKAHNS